MIPKVVLPMALGTMGLLVAGFLVAGLGEGERADYLPISRHSPSWVCRDREGRLHVGEMKEWVWNRSTDVLRGAGEPPLYRPAGGASAAPQIWRLTWLRSFDPPVIVRVSEDLNGYLRLDALRRGGRGLYRASYTSSDERVSRRLTQEEAEHFKRIMTQTRVFDGSPTECDSNWTDGARWVLETRGPSGHRFVHEFMPQKGAPIRAASDTLLNLTGWDFKGQYERNW